MRYGKRNVQEQVFRDSATRVFEDCSASIAKRRNCESISGLTSEGELSGNLYNLVRRPSKSRVPGGRQGHTVGYVVSQPQKEQKILRMEMWTVL